MKRLKVQSLVGIGMDSPDHVLVPMDDSELA
ncbi:hypothetical protein Htur_4855 (plasmid) [Haloterrigena turkmenica DSM 5511]|uniref:Uncharacterized protein n=1 Tax=Haloterrigena turkmenica (strain ATCC 51198 / DSM 5511 / JCM 9101 / NCIMB 13204 / VKM B-1734 / 4k) TaxID=543526 RepID=D2S2L6_HALTV|nr:hypothetical protein Htur_4855 [Haloterrigena turkmenica DSM 5511]